MNEPKLTRSQQDKMLAGVCGGLAAYLGIDSTIVRLAFLLLIPASGLGVLLYLILIALMPSDSLGSAETIRIRQEMGQETSGPATARRPHPNGPAIAGIFLILVGLYLLLDMGRFAYLFWPLLLMALGVWLMLRRR